jgi:ketosteroid isomerase-like protein
MDKPGGEIFEAGVRRLTHAYVDTILRSDADGNTELWDRGAIEMPPDAPMVLGQQAIGQKFRSAFERVTYGRFDVYPKEILQSGDYGFGLGNYAYAVRYKADGSTADREGKYLTIYRRQSDGAWKLYVDCFNLNARPK